MDDAARLRLNQMIEENDVTDQTELIRELKHSAIIKREAALLCELIDTYKDLPYNDLRNYTMVECNFLFSYYTDIYNRILKRELDISILNRFLSVLERIERGEIGQHEGSYLVGKALKELYIDSALKKSEQLDKKYNTSSDEPVSKPAIKVSWKQYKEGNCAKYEL
jgi:hypothetical protein